MKVVSGSQARVDSGLPDAADWFQWVSDGTQKSVFFKKLL